jgi:hypothetical protein
MKAPNYDRENLESARLILAERERYGGVMAALVQWAERIVAKQHQGIPKHRPGSRDVLVAAAGQ